MFLQTKWPVLIFSYGWVELLSCTWVRRLLFCRVVLIFLQNLEVELNGLMYVVVILCDTQDHHSISQ